MTPTNYRLVDKSGNVVYYGIAEGIANNLSHDKARTIEATLIHNRLAEAMKNKIIDETMSVVEQLQKAGLLNLNRGRIPERWIENYILPKLDVLGELIPGKVNVIDY
jgi:hypothetical protein